MNRDLEKILKERWYLVAADFIAVIGILCLDLNPKDGWEAFLAVFGIMGASLIVVIPVLMDSGDKKDRLAEQARLRTALAAEIDRLRDDFRAGTEAVSRRVGEVEVGARQVGETAAAAVAQRASAELNSLKANLAALELKVKSLEDARVESTAFVKKEAQEELATQVDALTTAVRGAVADAEEAMSALSGLRSELEKLAETSTEDFKKLRDDFKKAGQKSASATEKLSTTVEAAVSAIKALQANSLSAPAPRPSSGSAEALTELAAVPEAPVVSAPVVAPAEEIVIDDDAEEAAEETEADEVAPALESPEVDVAPVAAGAGSGTALTINLMIGIGNKPFVRGSGAGLSPDKGQLMTFLGIGRWQWVSPEPDAPATVEIWKNDQTPLGEPLHLSGGEPMEVDESHFTGA